MKLNMCLFIRRYILSEAFILLTCGQAVSADLESRLASSRASARPIIDEGLLTNPTEGIVIGQPLRPHLLFQMFLVFGFVISLGIRVGMKKRFQPPFHMLP